MTQRRHAAANARRERSAARVRDGTAVREDRRGEILRIAARRFADNGFDTTTMREIARDADILSGSIYHHFDTKEAMLHEIVGAASADLVRDCAAIAAKTATAEAKLVALLLLHFDELFTDADAYTILYTERRFFRGNDAFQYVAEAKRAMFAAWHAVMIAGMGDGSFRSTLDPFLAITTIVRMINTCADWIRHGQEEASADRHSRDAVIAFHADFVLRALRSSERIDLPLPLAPARRMIAELGIVDQPEARHG